MLQFRIALNDAFGYTKIWSICGPCAPYFIGTLQPNHLRWYLLDEGSIVTCLRMCVLTTRVTSITIYPCCMSFSLTLICENHVVHVRKFNAMDVICWCTLATSDLALPIDQETTHHNIAEVKYPGRLKSFVLPEVRKQRCSYRFTIVVAKMLLPILSKWGDVSALFVSSIWLIRKLPDVNT